MSKKKRKFIFFFLSILLWSNLYSQNELIKDILHAVSIDSVSKTIIDLQNFGTRYEYSSQQDSAGIYIYNRLISAGLNPEFEEYGIGQVAFYAFDFISPSHVWIAGSSGALAYSEDSGNKWSYLNTATSNTINDIEFYNKSIGWIVGSNGLIKKTSDQGNTWSVQNSGTAVALFSVSFIDENTGIIAGGLGKILKTTNGGTNWQSIVSGTNENLYDVLFLNQNNAWAVGNKGTILFSSNSGLSWVFQTPPANSINEYRAIYFIDSLNGWIATAGNFILKTTNGGIVWNQVDLPISSNTDYKGITFTDPSTGYLVEFSGNVLKTTDGGTKWFLQYSHRGWTVRFNNIVSMQNDKILVCGMNGYLFSSTDGGDTWFNRTSNLPSQFIHKTHNIVAKIKGSISPEKEYIFVAHYDSWSNDRENSAPGADDNASGTAAVIEAARILNSYEFEFTINFLLVSGEELGMFGSDFHAFEAKSNKRDIKCVLNADMIGYPIGHIQPRLIVGSYKTYNSMIDSILSYNQRYNLDIFLEPVIENSGASDYGPFAQAGYNSLHISEGTPLEIWGGANPYYHTIFDTYDKLNTNLLFKATQLLTASIAELGKPIRKLSVETFQIITEFNLSQNYPNPFNSSTIIEFSIPEESYVSFKIFDILGRDVLTIINNNLQKGIYKIHLNANEIHKKSHTVLTSGVYFYRLEARTSSNESYINTKKLLILK